MVYYASRILSISRYCWRFTDGGFEARIVVRKLMRETETIAWQILPISLILCGLPLLLAVTFFEFSDFLPIVAYLVLPFIPVYSATSGWRFYKFEQQNKVQVFMFIYGIKYWTGPILSDSDRLCLLPKWCSVERCTRHIETSKAFKRLMAILQERQDIKASIKKKTVQHSSSHEQI